MNAYKVWDKQNKKWLDVETGNYGIDPIDGKVKEYTIDDNGELFVAELDMDAYSYTLLDINSQGLYYGHLVEVYTFDYGGDPLPVTFGIETTNDVRYLYNVMEFIIDSPDTEDYINIVGHVAEM